MKQDPIFLVVDLFCGAGGTTTGFVQAQLDGNYVAKVIACVNHDPGAIKSHWANHPDVIHFEEDIRTLELTELKSIVSVEKDKYPDALLILWASLECTNFSKAKGGQPRDADSRTLAEHLERYVLAIDPDYVQIENVVEFMSWGPLDDKGKPVSRKNGSDWMRWCNEINAMGYRNEWEQLNSANFGAFTSRNRLFGVFAKEDMPIAWPEATHSKNPSQLSMHGDLQKWKAVKEVLDFKDEGISIFDRKKPLSDKTLERIYAGLIKYVANGDTSFISKYYSGRPAGKVSSVNMPAGTITTVGNQTLVQPEFLLQTYAANSKGHNTFPVENPARTITTRDSTQLVQPEFIASYYGTGDNVSTVNNPCPTLRTNDTCALVQPEYLNNNNQSIDSPAGTIMPKDKHSLIEASPFIMPTDFNNGPTSIEAPLNVITASKRFHYIVNPSHGGNNTSTDKPCPVIVARQDKAPLYLVQCNEGAVQIAVYEEDSEAAIRIKQFMVLYNLVDIKMRMLRVVELLKIQGFPSQYKLEGNQSEQKKFIGNSVVPQVVKAWIEAMALKVISNLKKKAA